MLSRITPDKHGSPSSQFKGDLTISQPLSPTIVCMTAINNKDLDQSDK